MEEALMLSVVIPVFNRWQLTLACLRSLRATSRRSDVEVIVVDNGSTDQTAKDADGHAVGRDPLIDVLVRHNRNQGFAEGSNAGLAAASGDVVVFLNNDTTACDKLWAPAIRDTLDDGSIGAVGALLWYPGRVRAVQHAGMAFTSGPKILHLYRHRRIEHEPGIMRAKDLQAVTGACLALRTADARQLGGFSPDYVNSFEDVDLCFRVRFELGLRVFYQPAIQFLHHEGQTEGRHLREAENEVLFGQRWGSRIEVDLPRIMREDRATGAPRPPT
jgi:GT2 family glycosyltransferase